MADSHSNLETLQDYLTGYERVIEVGIGRRTELAAALSNAGLSVTVTDIHERPVPAGVTFVRDDIVDPDLGVYENADIIYAQNLPPELHRPMFEVARRVDADLAFTTLGGDQPIVPVERKTVQEGTIFLSE